MYFQIILDNIWNKNWVKPFKAEFFQILKYLNQMFSCCLKLIYFNSFHAFQGSNSLETKKKKSRF